MRRAAITIPILAAVLATAAAASATRTVEVPSTVSIHVHELRFSGRVATGKPGCFQHRRVVLYKVVDGPDQSVGSDVTDARGAWTVRVSGWAGVSFARFYAKVRRSSEGTAGTVYVCLPARSRVRRPGS